MSKKDTTNSDGLAVGILIFTVFVILKVTGTIEWSWWWITSPVWIPTALIVFIVSLTALTEVLNKVSGRVK